ncbi:MAG: ATP-binding protein [Roseovarius sp.]|jgi:SpoVK/Ycf46/Vps4 family AAA+-type ATPase|nr:ATP-binding protein [Roseovarius sp.]
MGHGHHHEEELPAGVAAASELPNPRAAADWDRMVLPEGVKQRLLNWAVLALKHGDLLPYGDSALQRLLLLAGPPGTGKSTTARGLANAAISEIDPGAGGLLIELDPHALPSDMLGQSQRNVAKLMHHTIPGLARAGQRVVVVIDEVDAFAVSRSAASFETNPADLHRATDAVLAGLDLVARQFPSVLFVATTNFPQAVDDAVISRADWTVKFEYPDLPASTMILREALGRLATRWPSIERYAGDAEVLEHLAKLCDGLDGRAVAKLGTLALTWRTEVAHDPAQLTFEDLTSAAHQLCHDRGNSL